MREYYSLFQVYCFGRDIDICLLNICNKHSPSSHNPKVTVIRDVEKQHDLQLLHKLFPTLMLFLHMN